ncbi:MAG: 3-deoxy-8-phosphooctulonate synthase [Bdellovibrionota bacterium]|nr:3-deoxy-8-phosphooctulonate synthase [Bdellovibrionota bacterium]
MKTKEKFDFFIGPCVLESDSLAFGIAERVKLDLSPLTDKINVHFKGSFDKANRSSINSYRGPGIEKGLQILEGIKEKFDLPVLTDIHLPSQAEKVAEVVDIIQIPAFLCRQTDIIVSAAKACQKFGRKLKVKKGQFLSPEETSNIVEKASHYLKKEDILLTERGTSFGYNNLVVDMASFQTMKSFGVKAVHDATHCVQRPGGLGDSTGGKRGAIKVLARAAVAAGADGVFMEVHPEPSKALSDSSTCLPIDEMKDLVSGLVDIYQVL